MELVSDDIVLHEDILAVILASMSFEDLLHKRQIPIFKEATDSPITLDILSRMHNLPLKNTFIELLEEYDKTNLTPRCLRYHSVDHCARYFALIGDLDGIINAEGMGWQNYLIGMDDAAKEGHLNIVKYINNKLSYTENYHNVLNSALYHAAKGGHKNVIDYLIDNSASDWNDGIRENPLGFYELFSAIVQLREIILIL